MKKIMQVAAAAAAVVLALTACDPNGGAPTAKEVAAVMSRTAPTGTSAVMEGVTASSSVNGTLTLKSNKGGTLVYKLTGDEADPLVQTASLVYDQFALEDNGSVYYTSGTVVYKMKVSASASGCQIESTMIGTMKVSKGSSAAVDFNINLAITMTVIMDPATQKLSNSIVTTGTVAGESVNENISYSTTY